MKTKNESLSGKRQEYLDDREIPFYFEKDVKEKIQNAQRRLKEETRKVFRDKQTPEARKDKISCALLEDLYLKPFDRIIDKIFLEEFGGDLI